MPTNARWGKAGWGRTPPSLRRQKPPVFARLHDSDADIGTFGEIRVLFANHDSVFSSQREIEPWAEGPPSKADEE
jgi:hypothetical protein